MFFDTDILIWYMRGNAKARKLIESIDEFSISVVTYIELVQGMRNKQELIKFRKAIRSWSCKIIHIDESISFKAMAYVERHCLGHSLLLADALIGSTALSCGLTLVTGNDKHFKVIKELNIKSFRPC
jgi:predicted nucleic acid-binding protein